MITTPEQEASARRSAVAQDIIAHSMSLLATPTDRLAAALVLVAAELRDLSERVR